MPFTDSARGQLEDVVPTGPTSPTVPLHLQDLVDAIEARLVLRAADWGAANTFLAPFENGMLVAIESEGALYLRTAGAWSKVFPTHYTGTAAPAGTLGVDGDLYFQTS